MMDDFAEGRSDTGKGSIVPESIRKALVTGISALFMTEEGIRNMLADMRLPKDAMAYLVQQTERTRRELFRVISDELKGFLKTADLTRELRRALQGMKVQINAELRFVDDNPELSVKTNLARARAVPKRRPRAKKKVRRGASS